MSKVTFQFLFLFASVFELFSLQQQLINWVILPSELLCWPFIVHLLQWVLNNKQLCCNLWSHFIHFSHSLTSVRWLMVPHKSLWWLHHPRGNQWEINESLQMPAVQSVVVFRLNMFLKSHPLRNKNLFVQPYLMRSLLHFTAYVDNITKTSETK